MRLKLGNHVQYRIYERSLSVEHIKQAVLMPDRKKDAGDGAIKVWKKIGLLPMKITYDKIADAAYMTLRKGKVARTHFNNTRTAINAQAK